MNRSFPLRLLHNAWQQTQDDSGQILVFADPGGQRFGMLVKEFQQTVQTRTFKYRLGPDASLLGYFPLIDVLRRLHDDEGITDWDAWLSECGVYLPNRPIWRELLDDRFVRRRPLRLKEQVIQNALSLEDDIIAMLGGLTRSRPLLLVIANYHFASLSLQQLLERNRQEIPRQVLILAASDPEQLNDGQDHLSHSWWLVDDQYEPPWLIDLAPNLTHASLEDWPSPLSIDSFSIPNLIQQALENHTLLCRKETLDICDQIRLMLDERQILLVDEHRDELMLLEAEAQFYSDHFNTANSVLNELLEVARQRQDPVRQFDAYLRLAWCELYKHLVDSAQQMSTHAKTALESISDKNAGWLLREREWLLLQALICGQQHLRLPAAQQSRLEALLPLVEDDDYLYAFRFAQVNWEGSLNEKEKHFLKKALIKGLRQARQQGNRVAAVKMLQSMAVLLTNARRNHRALSYLNLALRLCQPLRSAVHEVPVLNAIGFVRLQMGDLVEARNTFHHALQSLQLVTNYNEVAATLNNLAWTYFVGGNLAECQRMLNTAIRLCRIRGFHNLPYHTLDDLLLHQALCRFYLGHSVLAQHTLLELNHREPELSTKGQLLYACLKLHFARSEADYGTIEQLIRDIAELLKLSTDLPAQTASVAHYAAGDDRLGDAPETGISWMAHPEQDNEVLPALPVDVMSLLRSAELEGELENLQQRVRDTRLLSHLSAQANAATDVRELVETICRQLSAHLDCDYVALDIIEQPYIKPIFVHQGLADEEAKDLHQKLALQKLTRGRLLCNVRNLELESFNSGYAYVNSIALPHHDFGDLVLLTRSNKGFDESVLRTSVMLAGQLAAAIQRLMHERELQHLSSTDMLTGLINRQALYPRLEEELARIRRHEDYRFCLAFLDLDNFKYLNDNFGHNLGDRVLRGFAKLLEDHTRTEDVTARLGGDEFVILFPGQTGENAEQLAKRLLERFDTTENCLKTLREFTGQVLNIDPQYCLGCSIGIVETSPETAPQTVDQLLNMADHSMYEAKTQGKNQAVFKPCTEPRSDEE